MLAAEPLIVIVADDRRQIVEPWRNSQGRQLVTVKPEYRDRRGEWRLTHSSLMLSPDAARELAPALLSVAAGIDGSPRDPNPTQRDREESRMP